MVAENLRSRSSSRARQRRTKAVHTSEQESVWSLEAQATAAAQPGYIDPATGYLVFTRYGHQQRGRCCGRACRHCPFAHQAVPEAERAAAAQQPCWLSARPLDAPVTLALRLGHRAPRAPADAGWLLPVLVPDRTLPGDGVALTRLLADLSAQTPVLLVPLQAGRSFLETAGQALALLPAGSQLVLEDSVSRHRLPDSEHIADWQDPQLQAVLADRGITTSRRPPAARVDGGL